MSGVGEVSSCIVKTDTFGGAMWFAKSNKLCLYGSDYAFGRKRARSSGLGLCFPFLEELLARFNSDRAKPITMVA